METKNQDDRINEGFLVIEINEPGKTILPKTLEEFEVMRRNSEYPSKSFHKNVKENFVYDIPGNQDNMNTSETPEDYQDSETSEVCSHISGNSPTELSLPTSSPTQKICGGVLHTETSHDMDLYSIPDDVSDYTLDSKANLSEHTKNKQKSLKKLKEENFLFK